MEKKITTLDIVEAKAALEALAASAEDDETLMDAIEAVNLQLEDKIDAIAHVLFQLDKRSESIRDEIRHLDRLRTVVENRSRRLKEYCKHVAERLGTNDLNGRSRRIKIRKQGGRLFARQATDDKAIDIACEAFGSIQNAVKSGAFKPVYAPDVLASMLADGSLTDSVVDDLIPVAQVITDIVEEGSNSVIANHFGIPERPDRVVIE